VEAALAEVIEDLSAWNPHSHLSRFNRAAAGAALPLPPHLFEVLQLALRTAADSDGAYDPTIGALTDLWGFGPGPGRLSPPSDAEIAGALDRGGWRKLAIEPAHRVVRQPGGLVLDVSSLGKGYAVDLVSERLAAAGARHTLVEIGGELRGAGVKPDGQPWWVVVELPPGADTAPMTAALHGLCVATSGDYRRMFEHAGRRYSHTLDPRTGRPVAHHLASVTVFHDSAMAADAHATAAMVLGPAEGPAYAERHSLAALFVIREGRGWREHLSPALTFLLD